MLFRSRSAALPAGLTLSTLTHHMAANQAGQQGYHPAGAANGGLGGAGSGTGGSAWAANGAGAGKEVASVGRLQQGGGVSGAAAGSSWTLFRGWQRQDS